MNKILIVSFHAVDNYGAVLQNYALQAAIGALGFQAETLDYRPGAIDTSYPDYFWPRNTNGAGEFVRKLARYTYNYIKKFARQASFQHFRSTYLRLTKEMEKQELSAVNGQYDVFITGSDQVWNMDIITEAELDTYTLQFVHDGKRAAYAASVGSCRNITPPLVERISTFDYISVRERSLKERLEQCGLTGVREVCDPVFLLEKERWEQLLPIAGAHEKPYVFVYYVSSKDICRLTEEIAAERGLEIRHVDKRKTLTVGFGTSMYGIGPAEFISYIARAETVVVSSFHGLAFAVLFEKEFLVIHHPSRGDRTRDLLDALGLSDRGFEGYEDYCLRKDSMRPIDWPAVKEKLAEIRENSRDVLRDICNLP